MSTRHSMSTGGTHQRNNRDRLTVFLGYAVLAGTCAAFSGICTKVGVSSAARGLVTYLVSVAQFLVYGMNSPLLNNTANKTAGSAGAAIIGDYNLEQIIELIVRVVMILSNGFLTAQMWRYLIKASDMAPTPVAHGVVTATNLVVSAAVGVFVLGETMPGPTWVVGAVVASMGLYLLLSDEEAQDKKGR